MDTDKAHQLAKEDVLANDGQHCCGGLRSAAASTLMFPSMKLGLKRRLVLQHAIRARPHLADACLRSIGSDGPAGPAPEDLSQCRRLLADQLQVSAYSPSPLCSIWSSFYDWWTIATGDPDIDVAHWLRHGAPLNVALPIVPRGVFPLHPDSSADDPLDLFTPADWYEDTFGEAYARC
eukprot:482122-Amphidinium_carterae.2